MNLQEFYAPKTLIKITPGVQVHIRGVSYIVATPEAGKVCLINLHSGNRNLPPVSIVDPHSGISVEDFHRLVGEDDLSKWEIVTDD